MTEDPGAFGETLRRAIAAVTRIDGRGRAAELVTTATEKLCAVADVGAKVGLVVHLSEPAAFTAPGRYLYVSRQLLGRGISEAGVAFVVAHELAHHALGHVDEVAAALLRGEACPHDPEREIAADRLALELCARAGYPEGGAREWLDLAIVGGEPLPPPLDRIARALGQSATSFTVRREALAVARPPTMAAPKGATATDMVVACGRCAVRFPPGQPCPRCGGAQLADLRDPVARARFLRTYLREGPTDQGALGRVAAGSLAALGGGALLVAIGAGAAAAIAALGVLGLSAGALLRDDARRERTARLELRPLPVAPPRSGGEEKIRGTVVLRRPVRSLVGETPCAAWRMTGAGPSGIIDDAAVGEFDLHDGGRVVARVDAPHAFVDLGPVTAALAMRALEGSVADALRARGRVPDHASGALAEVLLEEGQTVEVTGPAHREIVNDGMRGADEIWVFRDWPVIRRI